MQIQQGEPRLLDRVRSAVRMRHYSRRTEKAYLAWIRRFIVFHGKRHPTEMGGSEVTAFLSSLAARGVSASTQNQALSALLFLYGAVLGQQLGWMNDIVRTAARTAAGCPVTRGGRGAVVEAARHGVADGIADVRRRTQADGVCRAPHQGCELRSR